MPTDADNRRPLKTRSWPLFQATARQLARWGVSPNIISLSSILFACLAAAMLYASVETDADWARRCACLAAALCVQLRLVANLLDGLVAVEGQRGSAVGELYNEVPDRFADIAILWGAGLPADNLHLGAAAALVAVLAAYVRAMGASVGAGQIFVGPMAKPHRMATITFALVAAALLPASWQATILTVALWLVIVGGALTIFRRLAITAAHLRAQTQERQ